MFTNLVKIFLLLPYFRTTAFNLKSLFLNQVKICVDYLWYAQKG